MIDYTYPSWSEAEVLFSVRLVCCVSTCRIYISLRDLRKYPNSDEEGQEALERLSSD